MLCCCVVVVVLLLLCCCYCCVVGVECVCCACCVVCCNELVCVALCVLLWLCCCCCCVVVIIGIIYLTDWHKLPNLSGLQVRQSSCHAMSSDIMQFGHIAPHCEISVQPIRDELGQKLISDWLSGYRAMSRHMAKSHNILQQLVCLTCRPYFRETINLMFWWVFYRHLQGSQY